MLKKAEGITESKRILPREMPKCQTVAQRKGLAFERKVVAELARAFTPLGFDIAHNPWFEFRHKHGLNLCVPDILICPYTGPYANKTFVVEVKYTYVDGAIEKLRNIYCPVVGHALAEEVFPLVICRNLTTTSPKAEHTFFGSQANPIPLLQWLGTGRIRLGTERSN